MGFELFDYEGIIDLLNGDIELSPGLFQVHQLVRIQNQCRARNCVICFCSEKAVDLTFE